MAITRRSVLEYYYTDSAGVAIGWLEAKIYSDKSTVKTTVDEPSDADFSATDTTLTVADGSVFAVNDVIQIANKTAAGNPAGFELLYITAISSNNLTVSRGFNNTAPAIHAHNTDIFTVTGNNALLRFDLTHELNGPMVAGITLSNISRDLYTEETDVSHLGTRASRRQGPYYKIFENFKPIRVRDSYSKAMLFYGVVVETNERHDYLLGQVLELYAEDYLLELKENTLRSGYNYIFDSTVDVHASIARADALDENENGQTTYNTGVSSRGGLIKSFISHTSANIDFPSTTGGNDKRFTESAIQFDSNKDGHFYEVRKRRRKSVLAHIEEVASEDPHAISGTNISAKTFGYDFYLDHNITSTALTGNTPGTHKMYFNYFKRGTRPSPTEDVARYGLNIHWPHYYSNRTTHSDANTATNSFAETGQLIPMTDYAFRRPKTNVYTCADVDYIASAHDGDGELALDTHATKFECIEIKAGTAVDEFKFKGLAIKEGDVGTESAEFLKYNDASEGWVRVGRIQHINDTSTSNSGNFTAADPTRKIIISDIPLKSLTNANIWAEDAVWYGETTTGSQVTVKRVPRIAFGIEKATEIAGTISDEYDAIRERVFSVLSRETEETVEGQITTYAAPLYYIDNSPASIDSTSSTTQTFTLGTDTINSTGATLNPQNYGITIGMCAVKLDSSNNPTSTYGYLSAVTASTVTVTWATGVISASDTIRYYIPLKAGDSIHVRNDQFKFTGSMLVNKIEYQETTGVTQTVLTVTGVDNTATNIINRTTEVTKVNMGSHLTANATSLVVDDYSSVAVGDILLLEEELVKVTARPSSNTLTIERNYLDTKDVQHDDNTS
jgi:hypothetical protein